MQTRSGCTLSAGSARGPRPSCVTAQFHRPEKARMGVPGVSASCSGSFLPRFYAIRSPFSRVQVKSYYPLCDRRLNVLKSGRWIGPKCVGWRADLGLSANVLDRGLCRKSYPHFRENRYKHPAPFRCPRKKPVFSMPLGATFSTPDPDFCLTLD